MAPECVQVKIEIGHKSVCRTDTTHEGFTHDWVVFVRGADGSNISNFVEKVVFHLHESFPKPKRVIKLPPYKVEESGYGSFMLSIEIYFRNKEEPKKVKFDYDLYLQLVGNPPVTNVRVEALTFSDPVEDFKKRLLKGGGVIVPPVTGPSTSPPALANAPTNKQDMSLNPLPTFSPPTASPPPQAISKHPKKTSPSTPGQQGSSLSSKPPKLKEKDTSSQNANVGVKRSNVEDTPTTQKLKKKKLERSGEGTPKTLPKEVSIIGQPDVDKEKLKSKTTSSKKSEDVKERRKSGEGLSNLGPEKMKSGTKPLKENKKESLKDTKSKEGKDKVKKVKKTEDKVSDEPKVQKLTVKRTSTDAWSSTAKAGNGSQSKDNALNALFDEFGADHSESGDDEMETASPVISNKEESHHENPKVHATKGKKVLTKTKGGNNNIDSPKVNGVKKKDMASPQNGKSLNDSSQLVELWRRISTTEDRETLQKIVDIVESTGKFEVTDSTFDFDLCCLDSETIEKLRESLSVR